MTKYSIRFAINYGTFEEAALFSDLIPVMIGNFCDDLFDEIDNCTAVEAIDLETNSVVYGIYEEEEPEDEGLEFDNCDDDRGFDPYLGCYTDDV